MVRFAILYPSRATGLTRIRPDNRKAEARFSRKSSPEPNMRESANMQIKAFGEGSQPLLGLVSHAYLPDEPIGPGRSRLTAGSHEGVDTQFCVGDVDYPLVIGYTSIRCTVAN